MSINATSGTAVSSNFRQVLESEIDSLLGGSFSVLGQNPMALRVIVGVIAVESGAGLSWSNVDVAHKPVPATIGFGKAFENHHVVKAARKISAIDQTNLSQGRVAHSLLGCMGAYLIRGLHREPRGFPHVQASYSGLAESVGVLVNPGESLTALFTRDRTGLVRGLVAGMCVMEYNYKIYLSKYSGDMRRALQQTVRVHLGDPNSVDAVTGINSGDYLARVMNHANEYSSAVSGASALSDIKYSSLQNNSARESPDSSGVSGRGSSPGCLFS